MQGFALVYTLEHRQTPHGRHEQATCKGHMGEGSTGSDQGQNGEITAIVAIYGEGQCAIEEHAKMFCIRINNDRDDPKWTLCLQVMLPNEYTSITSICQLKQNVGESISLWWRK